VGLAMILITGLAIMAEIHYQEEGLALKFLAVSVISGLAGFRIRSHV